jgi:hypothetical protein
VVDLSCRETRRTLTIVSLCLAAPFFILQHLFQNFKLAEEYKAGELRAQVEIVLDDNERISRIKVEGEKGARTMASNREQWSK